MNKIPNQIILLLLSEVVPLCMYFESVFLSVSSGFAPRSKEALDFQKNQIKISCWNLKTALRIQCFPHAPIGKW